MKRAFTATGLALVFAAGLTAQQATTGTSGTTAQDPQTATTVQPRPRTVTGCLRAGDTAGTFILTNVEGLGYGRRSGSTTTGSTTSGTTATTSGTAASSATASADQGRAPITLMLSPDSSVDLKPHVGHKIELTGTTAGGGQLGGDASATTGTTTATGTATTATSGTTAQGTGRAGTRSITATSLKMISDSCS
jgi:hypothetical protein